MIQFHIYIYIQLTNIFFRASELGSFLWSQTWRATKHQHYITLGTGGAYHCCQLTASCWMVHPTGLRSRWCSEYGFNLNDYLGQTPSTQKITKECTMNRCTLHSSMNDLRTVVGQYIINMCQHVLVEYYFEAPASRTGPFAVCQISRCKMAAEQLLNHAISTNVGLINSVFR